MNDYGYEELSQAYPTPTVGLCVPLTDPHRQIRVLELDAVQPCDPNATSALYGRLRVIDLPSNHQCFTALSYVWAQQDPGVSQRANRLFIYCGDHQHEVQLRSNCWSALWHISKTQGYLKIWVDALCIEQGDEEEKSEQTPLMRTIYSSAHTTYFWLGEAATGTDKAMDYLSTSKVMIGSGRVSDVFRAALELFKCAITWNLSPHETGLGKIFNRPWIERLWTLQECLLAQNGIVICGEKLIHWPDLICALESLQYFRTVSSFLYFQEHYDPWLNLAHLSRSRSIIDDPNPLDEQQHRVQTPQSVVELDHRIQRQLWCLNWAHFVGLYAPTFIANIVGMLLYSHIIGSWLYIPTFVCVDILLVNIFGALRKIDTIKFRHSFSKTQHPMVQELRTRKATEPNDMYYGVAGILGDGIPKTDWKGSLSDHYRTLCSRLIQKTERLDMLLIVNSTSQDGFPSWVIDWHSPTPRIWDTTLYYFSSSEPPQHDGDCRSSKPRISKFCAYYLDWYFEDRLPPSTRYASKSETRDEADFGFLHEYQGATPGSQPLWAFRNQDQGLCVRGVFLTHISSHNVPLYTEIGSTRLRSAARALVIARNLDKTIAAGTSRRHAMISDWSISIPGYEAATRILDGLRMLTDLARGAFSGMTASKRVEIEKGFESLREVLPGEMKVESWKAKLWHRLRMGMGYYEGGREAELLFTADKLLRDNQAVVASFLRSEGLIMVRCDATPTCRGGLGFTCAAAQEGDAVALVSGVSLPLVLRRSGQASFKLIGPLFLPGVMNGELKDLLTPETLSDVTLV